ncbi:MAG: DOMON-like domain-containing protein [Novosphingobium sp.]
MAIGTIRSVRVPQSTQPQRVEGLWNHTCFEAFFAAADGSYVEFNFAPSGEWASFRFAGYREGMMLALDLGEPTIFVERDDRRLGLTAIIEFSQEEMVTTDKMALSAVIEETDGTKSYWALAHPPGKPDFHHPTCFAATLAPPGPS